MRSAILLCLLLVACKPAAQVRPRPSNLVVVTIDTLRADHVHCYGRAGIETPTLDRLAQQGALFENAVAQTPLTPPSHASIFTGTTPNVHGVRDTGGFVLPPSSVTLASVLQKQGWDTAAFVGASVLKKYFGLDQGFAAYDDQMPKPEKGQEAREYPERRAGVVVDHALTWLHAQSGKPFFVWLHLYDPHQSYDPPEPFRQKYSNNLYDGEIAYVDQQLGRFLDDVEKKAPGQTLVVVLADHGESLGDHGEFSHGVFLYDATLRIPLIVAGPGVPAGVRVKQQVRTIDVLPTILDLLGSQPPAACQGVSLVPAFSGKNVAPTISYLETLYPKINMGWAELRGVRTDRWKYIRAPKPELYDLARDPEEKSNVLTQHPSEAAELETQWKKLNSGGGAGQERVSLSPGDRRTMEQLKSLGYVGGLASSDFALNGKGPDPKDHVETLRVLESITSPATRSLPAARKIEMLRQLLAGDALNPTVYFYLGAEYEQAGRYDQAASLYSGAVAKGLRNYRLLSRMGDLYLREGKKDQAIEAYEQSARMNPADVESQTNLATAYLEKGRVADAERLFQSVLAIEDYAAAHNGLGLIAIGKRDPASARIHFERAVAMDPELLEAQLNLGLIYKMQGDLPRARTCFQAFLAKASRARYGQIIPQVENELAAMR
ncbi:MAG TPA: sulfatase-like hydrolase/transferase [Bryobacteraceae bacterium]|nr:sulfatase-like hydrolase/transferase [Bryobacteraceae bacterium]